ncbi:MFS transporter [Zwartia vadi]|uniref:MFS transporter n=1 Tax=Zwartia vadi TaxID=3058168 RepID=UPI0025B39BDC|nr:MFS transporter [Zwartia vadi]MDN3986562.1 MFS transporter [Zwartia vadi]
MSLTSNDRRNLIAGAIGNAIEFYDFLVYAYLAHYFATQFFPSDDPVTGLIASYGGFAAGMLMRPLGGVLIGSIGDKIGRKMALQISVLMISLPTFIIGFLPTYESIGIWAPILLLLMRLVQGLSVGGEYSAAIVFLVERASPRERGFFGSFSPLGAIFGLLLGSLTTFLCTFSLGQELMQDWGWRIPFISSIVLMVFGMYLRSKIAPDSILKSESSESPIIDAFRKYWRQMLSIGLGNAMTGAMSFIGFMYAVPWMIDQGGIHSNIAFSVNIVSLALCCTMTIVGGLIGDKFGRVKTVALGALIALCGAWPAFMLFKTGSLPLMLLGSLIIGTAHGLYCGPYCACMASIVPKSVRVTVIAFGYSFSVGIIGGLAPMITEYFVGKMHIVMAPAIVIMAAASIALAALIFDPLWRNQDESFPEDAGR